MLKSVDVDGLLSIRKFDLHENEKIRFQIKLFPSDFYLFPYTLKDWKWEPGQWQERERERKPQVIGR